MSWLDRFIKWVSGAQDAPQPEQQAPSKPSSALDTILEQGRQAQYSENYDVALQHYERAREVAQKQLDATLEADAMLHQADVMMAQGRFKDAETLLGELQTKAQNTQHRAPLAYAMISRGVLAQARGAYEEARNLYEQGRRHAETIASGGAQGRAMGHLADIYLAEDNSGYAAKLLRDGLALLEESGDTELIPYFQMRLADALIAAQDETEVVNLLHSAYKQATEAQHKPYRRMTALRLAEYATQKGDSTTAYQFYKIAFDMVSRTPVISARYVDAQLNYAQAALQTGQVNAARPIAEKALYAAESLGDETRISQAKAALEAASEVKVDTPSSNTRTETTQSVPQQIEPSTSETVQSTPTPVPNPIISSLPIIEDFEEEDPVAPLIAEAQRQLQQRNYAVALETLENALAQSKDKGIKSHRISIHLLMADTYRAQLKLEQAVEQQKVAYHIAKQTGERKISVQLLTQMATDQRTLGLLGDALRSINEALLLLSSVEDKQVRQKSLTLAGALYGTQGDTASADAFFQEALALAAEIGNPNLRAQTLLEYAIMLIETNRANEAQQPIDEAQKNATPQQTALAMGHLYSARGQWTDALAQYETAYSNQDDLLSQLETDRARTLIALNRYEDAARRLKVALQKAREYRRLGSLIDVLLLQSRLLAERGKTQPALDSLENVLKFTKQAQSPQQRAQAHIVRSKVYARMGDIDAAQADWEEAQQLIERHSMQPIQPDWLPQA